MNCSQNILFVDDDSRLLRGLQRALGSQAGFGLFFAERGAKAFDIIRENQIDFVVSGLQVGDMSGDALLEKVKRINPSSIRVMFSGEQVTPVGRCGVNGSGPVHRYINRPCDSRGLFGILKDIGRRWSSIPAARRDSFIETQLPALLPETAEYLRLCPDIREGNSELVEVLARDPGFICRGIYKYRRGFDCLEYNSLAELVEIFVRDGIHLHDGGCDRQMLTIYTDKSLLAYQRKVYNHCLLTSEYARDIARGSGGQGKVAISHALLAGLLHDIGKLILAEQYLQQGQAVIMDTMAMAGCGTLESEQEQYGINHCQFAEMLFSLWGLPEPVLDAIGRHHDRPDEITGTGLPEVLKVANKRACQ